MTGLTQMAQDALQLYPYGNNGIKGLKDVILFVFWTSNWTLRCLFTGFVQYLLSHVSVVVISTFCWSFSTLCQRRPTAVTKRRYYKVSLNTRWERWEMRRLDWLINLIVHRALMSQFH